MRRAIIAQIDVPWTSAGYSREDYEATVRRIMHKVLGEDLTVKIVTKHVRYGGDSVCRLSFCKDGSGNVVFDKGSRCELIQRLFLELNRMQAPACVRVVEIREEVADKYPSYLREFLSRVQALDPAPLSAPPEQA